MSADSPSYSPNAVTTKKRKDDKHRRRDPRSWENIKKSTTAMTEEERLTYMAKMYEEIYNENRVLSTSLQARDKQVQVMQKDSDRDRVELTKSILAKGQLESLCRELQKQNKLIKEENVARIKEEEDRRREVANTFTERLNALTNLITESKDKSNKVKEENQNMTEKLTELYEQYQQRENHLETVTKQLDLQKKLAETQAKKTEIEHEAERQTYLAEKKALLVQLEQYEREIVLLQEKNRSLEAQVDLYKSQYSDFETTMTKSNKVFDTFKEEMSRMNKQLHALESERNDLKKRWQSSVNSLIVLSEQHVALSNEQSALEKRLAMLQKLCRQLQEDRSAFLKQLKENNIEPIVPSVKNNESSENASEQNLETSKSNERALKLKQELGKAKKEVAALIKLGNIPSIDEHNIAEDLDLVNILNKGFHNIQNQIESTEENITEYLNTADDSGDASQKTPKRFKAIKEGPQGKGDNQVAGTSGKGKSKRPFKVVSAEQLTPQSPDSIETELSEPVNQPEVIKVLDSDEERELCERRAESTLELLRETYPSDVNLGQNESSSDSSVSSGESRNLEHNETINSADDNRDSSSEHNQNSSFENDHASSFAQHGNGADSADHNKKSKFSEKQLDIPIYYPSSDETTSSEDARQFS